MSLTGGYFCPAARLQDIDVEEKARSFAIIPGDSNESYKTVVCKSQSAHVVAKYKNDAPPQIRYKTNGKYSLITLGFHDLSYDRLLPDPATKIEKSEGEFVSILLEHASDRIHIINDRFASRPFYILQAGERVVFSSNLFFLAHLADCRLKPDPLGWLQIFSYSHTLGTRTNLADVNRIQPASHVVISKGGVRTRQYWRLSHDVQDDLDPVRHAEETFEAFCAGAAARSRLVNKGFVSLSGGLDSRLAAAAIPKDADFFAFTFADSTASVNTLEVKTAKQVSRILGREHRIKIIRPQEVSTIADCLIGLTTGMTPIHHPAKTFQAVRQMVNYSGFKMGGGPGDSLAGAFASGSIHNINPHMTDEQVYKFVVWRRKHSLKVLRKIFARQVLAEHFSRLDESMQECFTGLSGPTAAHRMTAWAMVFRQPAFTFSGPIHNHPDVTEASPHLGYDYADCMLKLPASWLYQKNFYKFMIWHCLPRLRDVVYANTGRKLPGRIQEYKLSSRKRICGAIERRLPADLLENYRKSRVKPDRRTTFEYDMLRSDKKLSEDIAEILYSFPGLKELLNVKSCQEFLNNFQDGRLCGRSFANDTELMGGLATLCYWYKNAGSML